MGMFDYINVTIRCPKCKKKCEIKEQVKWLPYKERKVHNYHIGDYINLDDEVYDYATYVRPELSWTCKCGNTFLYEVEVKDRKIIDARVREL